MSLHREHVRRALFRLGAATVGVGLVLAVGSPPGALPLPSRPTVQAVLVGGVLTVTVLALALALFFRASSDRSRPERRPEDVADPPLPDAAVDRYLTDRLLPPPAGVRESIRTMLRTTAVERIACVDGCSMETARGMVESGTWTDDRRAAAFLAERRSTRSAPRRVLGLVRFTLDARRVVGAIADLGEGVD